MLVCYWHVPNLHIDMLFHKHIFSFVIPLPASPTPHPISIQSCILESLSICLSVFLSMCPILSGQCLLNHSTVFLPNLVWWCIIMRQRVMQKNRFTLFNVKVTARVYIIKIRLFLLSFELLVSLQANLVWWCSIRSWSVLWKNLITTITVKVTMTVQNVS